MVENSYKRLILSMIPLLLSSIVLVGPFLTEGFGIYWPEKLNSAVYPNNIPFLQILLLFIQIFNNTPTITSAINSIKNRHTNVDVTVLLGVIGSLTMSIYSFDTAGATTENSITMQLYAVFGIVLLCISTFCDSLMNRYPKQNPANDSIHHFSIWYVPFIAGLSILAVVYSIANKKFDISLMYIILLSGSPAVLKLIYPLLFVRLNYLCEKRGIILQRPEVLSILPLTDVFACSLSEILTKGEPEVKGAVSQGIVLDQMLIMAGSAESYMDNSIAWAIVHDARRRKLQLKDATGTNIVSGMGIEAMINRMLVRVGSANLLRSQKLTINAEMLTKADQFASKGMVALFVNSGQYCRGVIAVEDPIAIEASAAIPELKEMSVECAILTGKDRATTKYFAKELGFNYFKSNLTPQEKASEIEVWKAQGKVVAALGKNLSFKPALDIADISIVPQSTHPDIKKNAHIILANNDIRAFSDAISLGLSWESKLTHCIIIALFANLLMLTFCIAIVLGLISCPYHPMIPLISTFVSIFLLLIYVFLSSF